MHEHSFRPTCQPQTMHACMCMHGLESLRNIYALYPASVRIYTPILFNLHSPHAPRPHHCSILPLYQRPYPCHVLPAPTPTSAVSRGGALHSAMARAGPYTHRPHLSMARECSLRMITSCVAVVCCGVLLCCVVLLCCAVLLSCVVWFILLWSRIAFRYCSRGTLYSQDTILMWSHVTVRVISALSTTVAAAMTRVQIPLQYRYVWSLPCVCVNMRMSVSACVCLFVCPHLHALLDANGVLLFTLCVWQIRTCMHRHAVTHMIVQDSHTCEFISFPAQ